MTTPDATPLPKPLADPVAALAEALVMPMVEEGFAVPAANRDEQWDSPVEEAKRIAPKAIAALDAAGFAVVPKVATADWTGSTLKDAEIAGLRTIKKAARAFVDFWEGPPYVSDDGEISDQVDLLRAALEAGHE